MVKDGDKYDFNLALDILEMIVQYTGLPDAHISRLRDNIYKVCDFQTDLVLLNADIGSIAVSLGFGVV